MIALLRFVSTSKPRTAKMLQSCTRVREVYGDKEKNEPTKLNTLLQSIEG